MADLPWPFVGAEVLAAKAIPERAMRTLYEPVYPGIFVPCGVEPSAGQRAIAAWLWSRRRAVVAGSSAAAMLGVKWVDASQPAELIHDNRKPPPKLVIRSETLGAGEVVDVDGVAVTNPARTAFDIGRHTLSRVQAVQRLDALANATDVKLVDVEAVQDAHPGARGMSRLRKVLPLVDGGAESPQETVARLALIDAGLPAPRTQFEVFNEYGLFVARVDMVYEDAKVGIEYDGPQHWTDPAVRQRDIDKQVELDGLGWNVIRVSRDLLRHRRSTYVHRVATALRERGVTW
jgi:REase_MTES_1575